MRNCVVCYGWTVHADFSQEETKHSLVHAGTRQPVCVWKGCLCVLVCFFSDWKKLLKVCAVLWTFVLEIGLLSDRVCVCVCLVLSAFVYYSVCASVEDSSTM